MKPKSTSELSITEINLSIFVRAGLNEDRVQFFLDRLRAGDKLEPLLVCSKTFELVDGRHRLEALIRFRTKKTLVSYQDFKDKHQLVFTALLANSTKGSLPPSSKDFQHTICALLSDGLTQDFIQRALMHSTGLPQKFVEDRMKESLTHLNRIQVRKAAQAVIKSDVTVAEAAKEFGVKQAQIQKLLKVNQSPDGVYETTRNKMRHLLTTVIQKLAGYKGSLQMKVASGELTEEQALFILNETQERLESMVNSGAQAKARVRQHAQTVAQASVAVATLKASKPAPERVVVKSKQPSVAVAAKASTPSASKNVGTPAQKALDLMELNAKSASKLTFDQFVLLAIEKLPAPPMSVDKPAWKGKVIHTVFSGFNDAARACFSGMDPVTSVQDLCKSGVISMTIVTRGAFIALPSVIVPNKMTQALLDQKK